MAGSDRRPARLRKPNPKYANDGWDKETLRILRASSESVGSNPNEKSPSRVGELDDRLSEDADQLSLGSRALSQSSDFDSASEHDDDMSLASNDEHTAPRRFGDKTRRRLSSSIGTSTHSRGIASDQARGSKRAAYQKTFGPDVEDLSDVLFARDTWLRARDVTLPSRRSIFATVQQSQTSPSRRAATDNEEHLPFDRRSTNEPFLADAIRKNQTLTDMDQEELHEKYLPQPTTHHSVVLGARGKQTKFNLTRLSPLDFGRAWLAEPQNEAGQEQQSPNLLPAQRYHEGWLIDAGERVQGLAWAPVCGELQYLAIVTRCTPSQRHSVSAEVNDRPAFHPCPAYPASIQIWAFQTKPTDTGHLRTLSFDAQPRLALIVGTDWGNLRRIKWCPSMEAESTVRTGGGPDVVTRLLGVLSGDGYARVLALPLPDELGQGHTLAVKAEQAGLTFAPPPDTVFTSLAFMDPMNLIVGASDGSIQLFDLAAQSNYGQAPSDYLKQQVHNTYITSLCPAWPSPFSTFVASTSASGELVLTDLRSPDQDKISLSRASLPHRDLLFSPFTRSFITGLDRAGNAQMETNSAMFVVCHHLRQFPTGFRIAKLPDHSGAATALANSPWHPCVLIGNARGQILSTNYLRKVLSHRRGEHRKAAGAFIQKICDYEWRPLSADGPDKPMDPWDGLCEADLFHGRGVRSGVSRFDEGFKPEKIEVGSVPTTKTKLQQKDSGIAEPIFEEEQAVTTIDWCPNASCAGLAAMGWGSGIVRVQDLAHNLT